MNIAILGAGNMGAGLARAFAAAGHKVVIGARDSGKAKAAAAAAGVDAADIPAAAARGDIVFLAVPYDAAAEVIAAAGGLSGKTVVDLTNPMTADYSGLAIGHTTSAAEEIARVAPEARIVKAFNTIFASVLAAGGKAAGRQATVFVAGDDPASVKAVETLAADAGFAPLAVGPLSAARYLEPVAGLNIALGYGRGLGTDIAPAWQRAA